MPQQQIELEEVTIKVPKLVLDFLRKTEEDPVRWIEYTIVDNVRAEVEGMFPDDWMKLFNLDTVFDAVLKEDVEEPGCFAKVDFSKREFLELIDEAVEKGHYQDRDAFIRQTLRREVERLAKQ